VKYKILFIATVLLNSCNLNTSHNELEQVFLKYVSDKEIVNTPNSTSYLFVLSSNQCNNFNPIINLYMRHYTKLHNTYLIVNGMHGQPMNVINSLAMSERVYIDRYRHIELIHSMMPNTALIVLKNGKIIRFDDLNNEDMNTYFHYLIKELNSIE
jgi:hypothetical protein